MRFGLNFFPSFRPSDLTTAAYFDQVLRMCERADELGYHSVKAVEHLSYETVSARISEVKPKRVLLTHLNQDMLDRLAEVTFPVAEDGMTIELN